MVAEEAETFVGGEGGEADLSLEDRGHAVGGFVVHCA